jgi:carbon monoxide dehydrogenase subunit G
MLIPILVVIAALMGVFIVVVALQPSRFQVTRSITIAAPAQAAFAQVNDLHNWEAWSPWAKLDPAMKQTYEGASAGTGASYTWSGNNQVGEGRMTITGSQPSVLIEIKLEFIRPFAGTNTVEFTFEPKGNQTEVSWNMIGQVNFLAKAFHLFMNMDKMVGGEFEKGLADLKSAVEAAA